MKYPLLLREIMKHAGEDAKDKGKLIKALAMVEVWRWEIKNYIIISTISC
jgi:hypothetical protein